MYFSTDWQNNFYLIYHIKFTQNKAGSITISIHPSGLHRQQHLLL